MRVESFCMFNSKDIFLKNYAKIILILKFNENHNVVFFRLIKKYNELKKVSIIKILGLLIGCR